MNRSSLNGTLSTDVAPLREAARLMRERAQAVPPEGMSDAWFDAEASDLMHLAQHDREHIAAWQPVVAVNVANWLDHTARMAEAKQCEPGDMLFALAVARCYPPDLSASATNGRGQDGES